MNNKILNKLLETYDTRYLDSLDLNSQKIWNDTTRKALNSKNHFIKNNINKVISRLVQNHFNNNKPITDLLSGPMSFTLQKSKKYNMNVYIFGEYHGSIDDCKQFLKNTNGNECKKPCKKEEICNPKSGRCVSKTGKIGKKIKVNKNLREMEIQEYFKKLLNNTDVFLDLYVEVPQFLNKKYVSSHVLGENIYIGKIFKTFKNCIQTQTRENNKNCELFRFHYIDIRKRDNKEPDLVISRFVKIVHDAHHRLFMSETTKTVLNTLKNINKKGLLLLYEHDIDRHYYLKKELNKTPLKKEILSHCKKLATEFIEKIDIHKLNMEADLLLKRRYSGNFENKLNLPLVRLGAFAVDIYTLSRMFRTEFKHTKFQPKKQSNIIMYAGDAHSRVYRSFLNSLDFNLVDRSGGSENKKSLRCVDLQNFQQPLFN